MSRRRGPHEWSPNALALGADGDTGGVCVMCGLVAVHEYEKRSECPRADFVDVDPIASRKARTSKRKGGEYELELVKELATYGLTVHKTPRSGGGWIKGDLVGIPLLALEAKRHERADIFGWIAQAERDATPAQIPTVLFRRSRSSSFACVPLKDLIWLFVEAKPGEDRFWYYPVGRLSLWADLDAAQNDTPLGRVPVLTFKRAGDRAFAALPLAAFLETFADIFRDHDQREAA